MFCIDKNQLQFYNIIKLYIMILSEYMNERGNDVLIQNNL